MLTREEVLAGWRAFLGRAPDETTLAGFCTCTDRAQLVAILANSPEFSERQRRGYSTLLDSVRRFEAETAESYDFAQYVAPSALTRTPSPVSRVAIIGACLLDSWAPVLKGVQPGLEVDRILIGHEGPSIRRAERAVDDYDCIILQIPLRMILPDYELFEHRYGDPDAYERALARCIGRLSSGLQRELPALAERPVFVMNYPVPQMNSLGRLLPRYDLRNPSFFIEQLNRALADAIAANPNVHLLDIDAVAAAQGRRFLQDDAFQVTSHGGVIGNFDPVSEGERLEPSVPLSMRFPMDTASFVRAVWAEVTAMMRTLSGRDMVKLVCVDIDDTLWRGIAAEMEEPDPGIVEGWPIGFAEALAMLRRRGIVLALVSKNDPERIAEIWPKVFHARLQLSDFAIRKISWNPKPGAVAEAIAEANVLPESVLFIDDNPVERAAVAAAIPGIRTLGAPHLDWRRTLLWSAETQVAAISAESDRRTEMIRAQGAREVARDAMDHASFLDGLNLSVTLRTIDSPNAPQFARAFELLNKTNQFNTTGQRWSLAEAQDGFAAGGGRNGMSSPPPTLSRLTGWSAC